MKFSEAWLRQWVNPDITTEQLAEQLSMAGLEVESVEPVAGEFEGVVVGEVIRDARQQAQGEGLAEMGEQGALGGARPEREDRLASGGRSARRLAAPATPRLGRLGLALLAGRR